MKKYKKKGFRMDWGIKKGSIVRVAEGNDNENYASFRGKDLIVTSVATNKSQHAGYDVGIGGKLFDLKEKATKKEIPFSLYDYKVEEV